MNTLPDIQPCKICKSNDWALIWSGVYRCRWCGTLYHTASGRTVECGDSKRPVIAAQPLVTQVVEQAEVVIAKRAKKEKANQSPLLNKAVEIVASGEPYTSESVQPLCLNCLLADCDEGAHLCLVTIARSRDRSLAIHGPTKQHHREPIIKAKLDLEEEKPAAPKTATNLINIRCPKCNRTGVKTWVFDIGRLAMCMFCKHRWSVGLSLENEPKERKAIAEG